MKFIFINTVLTSCKNLGNFGVNQNRIAVENVVVFGFYCEESVNLDLGPVNVLGEAFFSSCKVLMGTVSGATCLVQPGDQARSVNLLEAGGLAPRGPFAMRGISLLG